MLLNVAAVVIAFLFLFPFYWLLINSFKKSVIIALLAMNISFLLGVPAAYGIGRFAIPGKRILLLTFLVTQMMPAFLLLTPLYLSFSKVSLLNSYLAPALAVASGSIPFIIVTLRPYFQSVPKSLDDAARIDGCNAVTAFLLIMVPVIRTGLITILVISFPNGWNDLVYSMTFNVKENMRPLTANIYKFMDKYGMKWNYIMAYGMILVLPVTLMFVFLQKYIIGGLTAGAVKEKPDKDGPGWNECCKLLAQAIQRPVSAVGREPDTAAGISPGGGGCRAGVDRPAVHPILL